MWCTRFYARMGRSSCDHSRLSSTTTVLVAQSFRLSLHQPPDVLWDRVLDSSCDGESSILQRDCRTGGRLVSGGARHLASSSVLESGLLFLRHAHERLCHLP